MLVVLSWNMNEVSSRLRGEMAQQGVQIDGNKLCCSICLDLLKEPVTLPCGHNYCMTCIKRHFDEEDQKHIHSCPQCRQTFMPRPALKKNTMLAELVEDLKKTELQAAPGDHCYAGPGDVACEFCTGRKLKAVKSCLQCLVSYCEQHLQPHHNVEALKKHKLVDPSRNLQEIICPHHSEVMKIFCRTDQKCICILCSMDGHKCHHTVPAAVERTERQRELNPCREKIQQRVQEKEKDLNVILQEVEAINQSADEAVRHTENIFSELILLIQKRCSDIQQQIRSQQETEVNRAKELVEELEEELGELKRKDVELEKLSHTEDHTQFLKVFPSLSGLSECSESRCPTPRPLHHFKEVAAALSEMKDILQRVLREGWKKVSQRVTDVDVLLPQLEPKSRAEFLRFSKQLTLDPNTANVHLLMSEERRRVKYVSKKQAFPAHPERFMKRSQVLSRERLTGRHYWEVEWSGYGIYVAVAYKSIMRTGDQSEFGNNDKSWALRCSSGQFEFTHEKKHAWLPTHQASRIGVYVDHRAGVLSFYGVSEKMTLIHRVQTTFAEPLYAGLRAYNFLGADSSAVISELQLPEALSE